MIIEFDIYWTRCHMTVKLDEICKTEGKKVEVENRAGKWVLKTEYPAQKRRKLFKLNHRKQLRRDPGRCGAISDRQLQDLRPRVRRAKEVIM